MSPDRVLALALIELASTVSLSSADSGVSRLAAHNMRVIAIAEKRNSDLVNRAFSDEDRKKRFSIYEQLGDPKVPVIGPWNGFLHPLSIFVSCCSTTRCLFFYVVWDRSCGVAEAPQEALARIDISDTISCSDVGRGLLPMVRTNGVSGASAVGSYHCRWASRSAYSCRRQIYDA